MNITRYFRLLIKRSWIVILLVAVTLGSTYFYVKSEPITYSTKSTIIINPKVPNSLLPYVGGDNSYVSGLADNYALILKSDKFAQRVAEKLDFPISINTLKESYNSRLVPNTIFFYITGTSDSSVKAQKIANTVTKLFLSEGVNQAVTNINPASEDSLTTTLRNQRLQLTDLQTEIDQLKKQIETLKLEEQTPTNFATLRALRQDLKDDIDTQAKLGLSISQVESNITAPPVSSASLVDEAPPGGANPSNLLRYLLLAGFLSLIMGVAIVVLLDYLDYTIRTGDDLAELTGLNSLGIVPTFRGLILKKEVPATAFAADGSAPGGVLADLPGPGLSPVLIAAGEIKNSASEAYRILRTNILFSSLGQDPNSETGFKPGFDAPYTLDNNKNKAILVTSSLPQEGKSVTAANLAVAFAQTGSRVILVDTDLRQPTLHRLFGVPNENGFSNLVLSGPDSTASFLKQTGIPNLVLVTAGDLPPNPSELLTSVRASMAIQALRDAAKVLIMDSPPTLLVSDAAVLANRVDGVLVVVRAGKTRRQAISKSVSSLQKVGANIMGTVLNFVSDKGDEHLYYGRYGGYGYYGSTKKGKSSKKETAGKV